MYSSFGIGMGGLPGTTLDDWTPAPKTPKSPKVSKAPKFSKKKALPPVPEIPLPLELQSGSTSEMSPRMARLIGRRPSLRSKSSTSSGLTVNTTVPSEVESVMAYSPTLPDFSNDQAANQFPPSPRDSIIGGPEEGSAFRITKVMHYTSAESKPPRLRLPGVLRKKSVTPAYAAEPSSDSSFFSLSPASPDFAQPEPLSESSGSSLHTRGSSYSSSGDYSPSSATSLESITFKARESWLSNAASERTVRAAEEAPTPIHERPIMFQDGFSSYPPRRVEHVAKQEQDENEVIVIAPKARDRRRRSWSVTQTLLGKESEDAPKDKPIASTSDNIKAPSPLRSKTSMPLLNAMLRSQTPDQASVTSTDDPAVQGPAPYLATADAFRSYLDDACLRQVQPSLTVMKGKKMINHHHTSSGNTNMLSRLFTKSAQQPKAPATSTPPTPSRSLYPRFVENLPRDSTSSDRSEWTDISSTPSCDLTARTVDDWTEVELHQTIDKLRRLK